MARRVLVLGAAGQLGRQLCERFASGSWVTLGADVHAAGARKPAAERIRTGGVFKGKGKPASQKGVCMMMCLQYMVHNGSLVFTQSSHELFEWFRLRGTGAA